MERVNQNGILTGPLIFTLPTSSFIVVLSLNWLDRSQRAEASAKTHGSDYLSTEQKTAKDFASGFFS